ncbi:hypothetical protein SSX86_002454 [Deinandra increscens subsp. villosa]|uniref:F-box domain-containing protein n=1 Tax=Deinandra increscens subsp. villosa TaxID=3103831 RepID=A0AAP0DSV8_9ASTR
MDKVNIRLHYGGTIVNDPIQIYIGGETKMLQIEVDKMSLFEIVDCAVEITSYTKGSFFIYIQIPHMPMEDSLIKMKNDEDVMKMLYVLGDKYDKYILEIFLNPLEAEAQSSSLKAHVSPTVSNIVSSDDDDELIDEECEVEKDNVLGHKSDTDDDEWETSVIAIDKVNKSEDLTQQELVKSILEKAPTVDVGSHSEVEGSVDDEHYSSYDDSDGDVNSPAYLQLYFASIQLKHPMMEAKSPSKRLSSDIITTFPQTIIEIILCLLPIKEAARTSILSRDWRYKWTTIPKLEFDMNTVSHGTSEETRTYGMTSARNNMDQRCKLFYAIHQVLLLRQGPIHEFTLAVEANRECFELDQIILHLSRNHALKKLTLELEDHNFYKLPLCAFSLHQLTDLDLSCVDLDRQPIFSGFANLRSLRLFQVDISADTLLYLLSNCPSLKSFTLLVENGGRNDDENCTVHKLFECLPVIEHLNIYMFILILMLVVDSVVKEFPTSLIHLKHVCLQEMRLANNELRFLCVLIKSSLNLEKISLQLYDSRNYDDDAIWFGILEEYSDVWLENLIELDIGQCNNYIEIEFVKFILARSPKLKKLRISYRAETIQEELEWLKILVQAPRVSLVEILVK